MKACKHCGRIMGDKACKRHEKVCEKNPNPNPDSVDLFEEVTSQEESGNDELVQEALEQEDQQEEQEDQQEEEPPQEEQVTQPQAPPSFPAAMCPDTLILHENRQMFFKVIGRRIGDVIYIEEVKMLR